jgi:hypothetical protein
MKQVLVAVVALVIVVPVSAFPQGSGGTIAVFSDLAGTDCNIEVSASSIFVVYFFHIWHQGVRGVEFSAPIPPCLGVVHIGENSDFAKIGDTLSGVVIQYGECLPAPINSLRVTYFANTLTENCCYWPALAAPDEPSGEIRVLDCESNVVYGTGGRAIANPDGTCMCNFPVPVEQTTWGGIKALYVE